MQYTDKSKTQVKDYMKSLRKALFVLKCFKPEKLEMSSAELGRIIGVHHSTAYRIVNALVEEQFLERSERTGKYKIGPEMYSLGSLYLESTDVLKIADPVTKTLNELTGETVAMGIFDNGNIILAIKEESRYAFRLSIHIGTILPAYSSDIGKAFLSELSEAELDSLYPDERLRPVTIKTIATKTELKLRLEEIRKTGISSSKDESYEGVASVASLIRDASGKPVAGMAIPVPSYKMTLANRERLATLIRLGCSVVSYRLGYHDMVNPVRDIEEILAWWEQNKPDSAPHVNSLTQAIPNSHSDTVGEEPD